LGSLLLAFCEKPPKRVNEGEDAFFATIMHIWIKEIGSYYSWMDRTNYRYKIEKYQAVMP